MTGTTNGSSLKAPLIMFIVGIVAGIVGTILVPGLVRPYLPDAMVGGDDLVHGVVTGKRVETDRVLLTLPTEGGTLLATFTRDVGEIDLMIQEGDSLVLEVGKYEPFIENPTIARVVTRSSPFSDRPVEPTHDSAAMDPAGNRATPDSAEAVPVDPVVRTDTAGTAPNPSSE